MNEQVCSHTKSRKCEQAYSSCRLTKQTKNLELMPYGFQKKARGSNPYRQYWLLQVKPWNLSNENLSGTHDELEEEPGVLHRKFPRRSARHDPLQRHLLVHQLQNHVIHSVTNHCSHLLVYQLQPEQPIKMSHSPTNHCSQNINQSETIIPETNHCDEQQHGTYLSNQSEPASLHPRL